MAIKSTYTVLVSPMCPTASSIDAVAVPSRPSAVAAVSAVAVRQCRVSDSVTDPAAVPRCPGDETPSPSTHSRRCRRRRGSGRWCTGTRQVPGGRQQRQQPPRAARLDTQTYTLLRSYD